MFQKKDIIFSEVLGVCRVDDVTSLSTANVEAIQYYVLRAVNNRAKVSYIPVDKHEVMLRELISVEEANEKKKVYDELPQKEKDEIDFVLNNVK